LPDLAVNLNWIAVSLIASEKAKSGDFAMGPIASEFPKWQQWAERIKTDVENRLVNPRQVFRGFVQIINANAKHIAEHDGAVFVRFVQRCYVSLTAMAIRSHVKQGDESISLARLLTQIRDCADQFTFRFFLQQFPPDPSYVDWQTVTFAHFSEGGNAVSPAIVNKDIDDLKALTAQVEKHADRSLAHLDKRGFDGLVTFGDLDACIDTFDRVVCKYLKLLNGGGYSTLEPTILADWTKLFTVPLDIRTMANSYKELD
jgi:hypothetical protein